MDGEVSKDELYAAAFDAAFAYAIANSANVAGAAFAAFSAAASAFAADNADNVTAYTNTVYAVDVDDTKEDKWKEIEHMFIEECLK